MHTVKVRGDYINGKFVRPKGAGERIISKDPGDAGYRIGSFPTYPQNVEKAVSAARNAHKDWRKLDIGRRADMLRKFSAEVVNHRDELKELIAAETGKPLWEAEQEVLAVEAQVETEVREGIRSVSPFKVGEIRWGVEGNCRYRPLGVVAVLGPAISPVHLPCGQIIPALLAGNTVVFKPSKLVPAIGQFIARLFAEIELPRGVFNLVQGDASIGSVLSGLPEVDGVLFTGSYPAGKRILQATADQFHKLVALQLGGVNPALVLEDADLERAVYECAAGAFLTSGQQYTSTGVILVERKVFESFTEAFLETVRSLKVGYAFDPDVFIGPVLTESARVRFLDAQERLDHAGARALLTSRPLKLDRPGYYLSPAVHLAERVGSIDTLRPEGPSFGPDVILIPCANQKEAVELANKNQFAFASTIFTKDVARYDECLRDLEYGIVNFNMSTTAISMRLPLDGSKKCGNHRPAGVFAQRNCCYPVASLQATTPFDSKRKLPGFSSRGAD
jgi:succinylglutamic semialdehyde dehydrogenase